MIRIITVVKLTETFVEEKSSYPSTSVGVCVCVCVCVCACE